ncbi:MAG: uncharacterized protein A8A55_3372, partial [Amphiamblys sp. WSBS2006]
SAEDGAGKQGVGIAIHRSLEFSELGAISPYFCLCEIRGLFGRLTLGSVYIPCGAQTATMEILGMTISKLVARGGLLGGNWNMGRKELEKEAEKWLLDTKVVGTCGSEVTRHGYSPRREDWSALDFFLTVGPVNTTTAEVDRDLTISDNWPATLKAQLISSRPPKNKERKISRMGIRNKAEKLADHPLWTLSEVSVESMLENIKRIADEQNLWCRGD